MFLQESSVDIVYEVCGAFVNDNVDAQTSV